MNKKGFTLIELLSVIAILAILVLLLFPNIIEIFNNVKKDSFITEVKTIYKAVEKQMLIDSLKGNDNTYYANYEGNTENTIDLSGKKLNYCVIYNNNNKIVHIAVSDENYSVTLKNEDGINITSIDNIDEIYTKVMNCSNSISEIELYTKLEYLESKTADKQYIDTLYQVKPNTTVVYDGMTVSGDTAIFGYRRSKTTSDIQKFAIQYISSNIYRVSFGKIQYEIPNTYIANNRYLFKMNNTKAYINNIPVASFENLSNFETSGNLYLFAINTGGVAGNFGKNRIYSFKIYEGSTLVKSFIPVLDKNNIPCLYETIGEKFYYNKGSGTFNYKETIYYTFKNNISYLNSSNTNLNMASGEKYETTLSAISGRTLPTKISIKFGEGLLSNNIDYTYNNQTGKLIINEVHGNVVIDEASEIRLSYLTSSGSQYINTGYIPTINTKVIFTHIPLVSTPPAWAAYFGTKDSTGNTNTFYVSAGANKVASWIGSTQISANNTNFSSTIGSTQVITLSASEFKIVEDGVTKVNKTSSVIPTFTDAKEIYIFGRNANGINYPGSFRVKSFQIYENDILKMDLIPIIDYEGKYCFYDNISKKYYYNQGTGTFTGKK